MTKATKWHVRPAKTQISLGIHTVWSESSLCAQWVAKDPSCLHADSEDSDQTGRMPRLIWVFAGRIVILYVLSWGDMSRICHVSQVWLWGNKYVTARFVQTWYQCLSATHFNVHFLELTARPPKCLEETKREASIRLESVLVSLDCI